MQAVRPDSRHARRVQLQLLAEPGLLRCQHGRRVEPADVRQHRRGYHERPDQLHRLRGIRLYQVRRPPGGTQDHGRRLRFGVFGPRRRPVLLPGPVGATLGVRPHQVAGQLRGGVQEGRAVRVLLRRRRRHQYVHLCRRVRVPDNLRPELLSGRKECRMRSPIRVGFDADLVTAARAGDLHALEDLVAACLPLVYNIVRRALPGQPDVDDVAQEALLHVVRHLPELRDVHAFRSWLVAITVHEIRDYQAQHSTARYRRIDLDAAEDVPDPGSDVAGMTVVRLGLADQRREVAEATRWLDPDDQELLALWWLEETGELSRSDLAGALHLSGRHAPVRWYALCRPGRSAPNCARWRTPGTAYRVHCGASISPDTSGTAAAASAPALRRYRWTGYSPSPACCPYRRPCPPS